jgi:hypothetical protein
MLRTMHISHELRASPHVEGICDVIRISVSRVPDDKVDRLRAWLREAGERADEVRQTLVDEGVTHERAELVATSDGFLLVYSMECADYDAAKAVFERSTRPIDVEHKRVMTDVRGEVVATEVLLDVRA